jgi:hypothetical protein
MAPFPRARPVTLRPAPPAGEVFFDSDFDFVCVGIFNRELRSYVISVLGWGGEGALFKFFRSGKEKGEREKEKKKEKKASAKRFFGL